MRKEILGYIQNKYAYSDHQIALLNHGIDILLNDGINMITLLGISIATGDLFQGVIYILTFSGMRRYSGGWHASTRFRCFLSYQITFILLLVYVRVMTNALVNCLLYQISIFYIVKNAPVQHKYNPLSKQEILDNKRKLLRNMIFISIAYIAFSLNQSQYAFTLCYTAVWNAICMVILKHSSMWGKA